MKIDASSNAVLEDSTGNGTFDTTDPLDLSSHGLYVRNFLGASPNFEDRAVVLFSLAGLSHGATITGLSFNFDETSYANNVGTIDVNGFSSNGTITLADATAAGSGLGSYDALSGLGNRSVVLSTSYLQSLLAGGATYIGIRLQGTQYGDNTSLGSIEQASSYAPPTLTVAFTSVPEPSGIALLVSGASIVGLGLRVRAGRRRSTV